MRVRTGQFAREDYTTAFWYNLGQRPANARNGRDGIGQGIWAPLKRTNRYQTVIGGMPVSEHKAPSRLQKH